MPAGILLALLVSSWEAPEKDLSAQIALNAKTPAIAAVAALNADSPNLPDRPLTLVKLIKPIYPDAARAEALSGAVQMEVAVDEDGTVDSVKTVSGHPVLAEAAASAIRRWTYQAAVQNGKPVRTTTVVKLNFKAPE